MKQKNNDELLLRETIEASYEKLTLKDDFMFGKVMQNERNKDIDMLPRRARFYQGMVDLNLLESGGNYRELKNSYIIFICTFDPFGNGLSCYEFENVCKDNSKIKLLDGRKILIYNTKGKDINVDKRTLSFLEFIETNKVCDEYTERLSQDVAKARMNKEWRVEYMKTLLHDMDVREEGREEGREETTYAIVMNMLRKGVAVIDICELTECSEEYVEGLRQTM